MPKVQPLVRRYIVAGRGTFPFDMLRYDQSVPDSPQEAAKMGTPDTPYEETRDYREIVLQRASENWASPHADRWASFLWTVIAVEGGVTGDFEAKIRAMREAAPRSYRPMVRTGRDPKFYGNGLRFATREEAQASADELASRWMLVVETGTEPSDEAPNYVWFNGQAKPLREAS